MCLIIVKPSHVDMPHSSIMQKAWDANSDGAGFMFVENGKVYGRKGFMSLDDLLEGLQGFEQHTLVIHFRWATHGSKGMSATHPFPVSGQQKAMKALEWEANLGVAHNGIIKGFGNKRLSDTQEFVYKVMAHTRIRRLSADEYLEKLARSTSSKFAFLDANGDYHLAGKFELESDGCYYSNLNHLHTYYNYTYYGQWSDRCDYCGCNDGYSIDGDVYMSGALWTDLAICDQCFDHGILTHDAGGNEVLIIDPANYDDYVKYRDEILEEIEEDETMYGYHDSPWN